MRGMALAGFLTGMAFAWALPAQAEIFKCQDAGGKISYQGVPCAEGVKPVKSATNYGGKARSDLPCDQPNVGGAERKLAVYLLRTASDSAVAIRSGGSLDNEVSKFRRASVEAGNIAVPSCMEQARDVMQKYLDFTADQLLAIAKGHDFSSGDARSANLRTEFQAALESARTQAREPKHVWATTGK